MCFVVGNIFIENIECKTVLTANQICGEPSAKDGEFKGNYLKNVTKIIDNWKSKLQKLFNCILYCILYGLCYIIKILYKCCILYGVMRNKIKNYLLQLSVSNRGIAYIKTKYEKIFLRRISLTRFMAKTLRVNKIAVKSFPEKSVVRSRF